MNLNLSDDHRMLQETFERFLGTESSPARVRAAEATGGFDADLWRGLADLGALVMRSAETVGGGATSLLDTCLLMEEAGRRLASVPLAEGIVVARVLSELQDVNAQRAYQQIAGGECVVTLALHDAALHRRQVVPGLHCAQAVLAQHGSDLILIQRAHAVAPAPPNLAGAPIGVCTLVGESAWGESITVARGDDALRLFQSAVEEWKLYVAAALVGIAQRSLEIAAEYSREREQFGKPIGSYQGISHPLADLVCEADGAKLLLWRAIDAIARDEPRACALVDMLYWWSARTSGRVVSQAIQTLGGYGLSLEYDIQLFHRRAKSLALTLGDPLVLLDQAAERLWTGASAPIPQAGEMPIEFDFGESAHRLEQETRAFFESKMTPRLRAHAHHSFEGHDWEFHRALASARLLFPDWPSEHGGRNADPYENAASAHVWDEFDWTISPVGVASMVGRMIMWFGTDELKRTVLPRIASGEVICSLGYSEPASGSDVFAAKTSAVRQGDHWIVNGQKMFTSGANIATYVMLLARTDPDAPKHKGITMFIVPLDAPGIEIQPVYTYPDERTNITFYSDVRVPDAWRLGEVNGGLALMTAALKLEQGGAGFVGPHRHVLDAAVEWARSEGLDGRPAMHDPLVRRRLAQVAVHVEVSELIYRRSLWAKAQNLPDQAFGPMSKLFTTEAFLRDATDMLDLTAPHSLFKQQHGLGVMERAHRHAAATRIYGGTSEVQRSLVAEKRLGMPRSR